MHSLATMAQTFASNLDYVIKVHVDSEGCLAAIKKECCKEIEAGDTAKFLVVR